MVVFIALRERTLAFVETGTLVLEIDSIGILNRDTDTTIVF